MKSVIVKNRSNRIDVKKKKEKESKGNLTLQQSTESSSNSWRKKIHIFFSHGRATSRILNTQTAEKGSRPRTRNPSDDTERHGAGRALEKCRLAAWNSEAGFSRNLGNYLRLDFLSRDSSTRAKGEGEASDSTGSRCLSDYEQDYTRLNVGGKHVFHEHVS